MTNRTLVVRPGPKRLSVALALAGFSPTRTLAPVTDACGVRWEKPSELQVILALCGGEASGCTNCYHQNPDGSTDYGVLEINDRAHPEYFHQAQGPASWQWADWIDNAAAAWAVYIAAARQFTPWKAYSGGGYLAERYEGRSWMDWSSWGISQALPAVAALVKQGKTQAQAFAQVASIADDPLTYWQQ